LSYGLGAVRIFDQVKDMQNKSSTVSAAEVREGTVLAAPDASNARAITTQHLHSQTKLLQDKKY